MAKHRCNFKVCGWCAGNVLFRCHCGEEHERKMTCEEKRRCDEELFYPKLKNDVHRVYHQFAKKFKKDDKFLFTGYDLMERAEKWAKKFPGDVRIVGCDDSVHASSSLVLIEHRANTDYMGTTVVYVPQCTGESPIEFFLYPSHRSSLLKALHEIAKEAAPREKKERKAAFERSAWWNSRPKP